MLQHPSDLPHAARGSKRSKKKKARTTTKSEFAASNNGLEVIRNALGLSDAPSKESPRRPTPPILFSVDLENLSSNLQRKSASYELGIAIFDPQKPKRAISTYNFVGGSTGYFSYRAPRFLFGQSFRVEKNLIGEFVKSLYPESREAVLVAHNLHSELLGLDALGISLPFAGGLDTEIIAAEVYPDLSHAPSLKNLAKRLDIPIRFSHCAGNDAHVTLVALLGLACVHPECAPSAVHWKNISSAVCKLKASIAEVTVPLIVLRSRGRE